MFCKFTQILSCSCLLLLNVIFRGKVLELDVPKTGSFYWTGWRFWVCSRVGLVSFFRREVFPRRFPVSRVALCPCPRPLLCYSHGAHEGSPRPQGCSGSSLTAARAWERSGKTGNVIVSRALGNEWAHCGQDPDFVGCIMQYSCT